MMFAALLLLAIIAVAHSKCDNSCSGHGTCNQNSLCTCFDNWGMGMAHDDGDCSERTCPFEVAWVDTPDKSGIRHKYAECAGKGLCNRESGECECFAGYEGKACKRSSCPNDCSGHGTCEFIDSIPFGTVTEEFIGDSTYYDQDLQTFPYKYWDAKKTRGCVCDPEYSDVDCSKRVCPHGNDVMDIRLNLDATLLYQVQNIYLKPYIAGEDLSGSTFALTFTTKTNETATTIPIVFDISSDAEFKNFMLDIASALKNLPNCMIDDVEVAGSYSTVTGEVMVNVSFTGDNVQGPQHKLNVKAYECKEGCTPKITGMALAPKTQNVTEIVLADYNSFECGRRGKCDYESGICACFVGYTGLHCQTITALI